MVLPAYQSLKGSQDSLTVSGPVVEVVGSGMRRAAASSMTSASSLDLSSLTLSKSNISGSHLSSMNASTNNQSTMLQRGWGSVETRRASTSLNTMAGGSEQLYTRRVAQPSADNQLGDKDSWGYFVDVAEDGEEDALMW